MKVRAASLATGRVVAAIAPFAIGGVVITYDLAFAIGVMAVFYLGVALFGYLMKEGRDTIAVD